MGNTAKVLPPLLLCMSALSSTASAADLPAPSGVYTKAPVVVDPPYNWSGFYVGGNIGYSWGRSDGIYNNPAFAVTTPPLPTSIPLTQSLDGVIGGAQIGYNWQVDRTWLLGLEADFQGSGEKGSASVTDPYIYYYDFPANTSGTLTPTISSSIDWFGTVRGRIGALVTPTTLLYATGGLAYGHVRVSGSVYDSYAASPFTWTFGSSATKIGWTVGAGIEGAIPTSTQWTWKIEYLYVDLGSLSGAGTDTDWGPYSWSTRITDNIVRVGVNYRFGSQAAGRY